MISGFSTRTGSTLPLGRLKVVLLAWVVAEIVSFVVVVKLFGFGGAVLLGLLTTVIGLVRLQRIGMQAWRGVRTGMFGMPLGGKAEGNAIAGLGAVLMILPGFASDALGLALAAPTVQRWLRGVLTGGAMASAPPPPVRRGFGASKTGADTPDVIDLGPEDWRVVDKR